MTANRLKLPTGDPERANAAAFTVDLSYCGELRVESSILEWFLRSAVRLVIKLHAACCLVQVEGHRRVHVRAFPKAPSGTHAELAAMPEETVRNALALASDPLVLTWGCCRMAG
jgi:hypothetical protein